MKTLIRTWLHKLGIDIVRFKSKSMGVNPYYDMSKFIKSDNPVFFDVGANRGQTVFAINEEFKNSVIHSFEPSPNTFKRLCSSVEKYKQVYTWNYGLGSETGRLALYENDNADMSSFLELGKEGWGEIDNKTTVNVITVDDFCKTKNIERIDVLKLDTQGFELEVLKGSVSTIKQGKIGLIYFEVTFIEMYKNLPSFSKLYDFCIENDFELVAIYPLHYNQNMAGWTDVLFKYKNY